MEIEIEKLLTQTKLRFHFPICHQPSRFFWGMGSGFFTASNRETWGSWLGYCGRQVMSTRTGISFLTGIVSSDGGSILKSESVAGIVPVM